VDGGQRYGVHPQILGSFFLRCKASEKLPPARAAFIFARRYCPRDPHVATIAKVLKLHMIIATKTRVEVLVAFTLLGLTGISSRADKDKPTEKDLTEKTRRVSDIRAEGARPFRLEGTFRVTPRKGGREIEGSYTEIWFSKSMWRREVQTSSFRRVEVGAPVKTRLADSGTDRPEAALYGPLTLIFSKQSPEMHRVSHTKLGSTQAICVESKSDEWSKAIDCFDPASEANLPIVAEPEPAPRHARQTKRNRKVC